MKNRILKLAATGLALFPVTAIAGSFYLGPMIEFNSFAKNHARFQGIFPHLTLGYGDLLTGCIYLGGEIYGGPATIKWSNHRKNGTNLKTNYNYGVAIIPGYILDNVVMAYLRFGVTETNFNGLDTTKPGFRYGIGLEGILDLHWSVRGEYDFTKYSAIHGVGHVTSDTYAIGLKYTFL